MKYFVIHGNKIVNVLDEAPTFVPEGHSVVRYNGYVPLKYLEYRDGIIVPKDSVNSSTNTTEQYRVTAIVEIKDTVTKLFQQAETEFLFNIPGYEAIFNEKVEQALDYLTDPEPIPKEAKYPLLAGESKALSVSMGDVATHILMRKKAWLSKVAKIDEIFLRSVAEIEEGNTESEIHQVKRNALSTLLQIK